MEVPVTKTGTQYLEYGIQGVDSRIHDCLGFPSLSRRRNLTPVSNVCKAALKSLFWAPNRLNELTEVCLEFPFNLIGKSTMVDTQILAHRWRPSQNCLADGLSQSLVLTVTQAKIPLHRAILACVTGGNFGLFFVEFPLRKSSKEKMKGARKKGKENIVFLCDFCFAFTQRKSSKCY